MATIKAHSDLEQSKVLAGILPLESADMFYTTFYGKVSKSLPLPKEVYDILKCPIDRDKCVPCWSLAALINILPEIQGCKPIIALDDNYTTYPHISDLHTKADNLVDACVGMIIKLHELNLL